MTYEVKMGVPIPKRKAPMKPKSAIRLAIEGMPVGGMIEVASDKQKKAIATACVTGKASGKKFVTRPAGDGVLGIWRVA